MSALGSGPDWGPGITGMIVGLATLLTAAGGAWAIVTGGFRQKKIDEATGAEKTLDSAFVLIKKLQDERDRCDERLEEAEQERARDREEKEQDRKRIKELELEKEEDRKRIQGLEARVDWLEAMRESPPKGELDV